MDLPGLFIDPEEDEVFFAPFISREQQQALESRRKRRTIIFNPNRNVVEAEKENTDINNFQKSPIKSTPLKSKFVQNSDETVVVKNEIAESLVEEESFDDVGDSVHNTTPYDCELMESVQLENLIETSIKKLSLGSENHEKENETEGICHDILESASVVEDEPQSIQEDFSAIDCQDLSTASELYQTNCGNKNTDDSICNLEDVKKENDLRISIYPLQVDESVLSWANEDVNEQIMNLTPRFSEATKDVSSHLEEELERMPPMFHTSSTPRKLPLAIMTSDGKGESARKVPTFTITEPTPIKDTPSSPFPLKSSPRLQKRPIRFTYAKSPEQQEGKDSSGSSGSFKSCGTPHSTPFVKPTAANIPKSSKRSANKPIIKAVTEQKTTVQPVSSGRRMVASSSKIPTVKSGLPVRTPVAKSLQFAHMESPLTKYIHQKETPLICNAKSKIVSGSSVPLRTVQKPKQMMPVLPQVRYQQGVPCVQKKSTESRLPRLGPTQLKAIQPLSPRIVKHVSKVGDVSILVASEAKMATTPTKK